ncbi:hypothetical protein L1987_42597 [Smallanthus sonchifolius]|uniref:Uncharacterized protein n=1 Tax=Smallanthus sonchifolius TaxID=185202 RepID=A0ACB9GKD8_9ASTR|nr:hypothetical protein L1987_42597 [Smallanthus sonchifolius]
MRNQRRRSALEKFAVNKKVEILELDIENSSKDRNLRGNYEFPLTLSDINKGNLCKWPYSEARVVELVGMPTDLRLINLPKLKEVKIYQGLLDNVLFGQIFSCVSSVQTLSTLYDSKRLATLVSIPQMPNVKQLMLTMGVEEDDCLLEVASIVEACPNLETFIIKLLWFSPVKRRRKARHVANDHHPLKNLKLFKILGYYGRISDFELAAYVIDNAVALEKIVIDPRCRREVVIFSEKDLLKKEKAARSSAERRLKAILPKKPPGVKLVIL